MRVDLPPPKPLLIFDGECGFCRYWIGRWQRATGEHVDYAPSQQPGLLARFPEIPAEIFDRSVVLVEPSGEVSQGARAVTRSLAFAPGRGGLWWCYQKVPGFAPLSELAYRVVANNRMFFSRLTRWFFK